MPVPLYGQCAFVSLTRLGEQLAEVSAQWLGGGSFSAYVLTEDDRKYYGLTLDDLMDLPPVWSGELLSLTAVSSHAQGRVVRVNVQFFPPPTPHRVRYLIATGEAQRNYAIRQILSGEPIPAFPTTLPRFTVQEVIPPALRPRPDALTARRSLGYRQPTLTLHDHFYLRPNLSADELVDLCNELSERFLRKAEWQLRLETIDGDFHLHLDRRELRYLFERQADKRLMLYLDSRDGESQWLSLRLIFHPLFTGPNAEVNLISSRADDLLDVLQSRLGSLSLPEALPERHWWPSQSCKLDLKLPELIEAVSELSQVGFTHLPVQVWAALADGSTMPGLSLYQLVQRMSPDLKPVRGLVFFLSRISTGQVLALWLQREAEDQPLVATLGLMWGERDKREVVDAWWQRQTWLTAGAVSRRTGTSTKVAVLAAQPNEGPDRSRWLVELAKAGGREPVLTLAQQPHRVWDQAAEALFACPELWVEMSYKQPGSVFLTELAQRIGLTVRLLVQEGYSVPDSLASLSVLRYRDPQADQPRLLTQLR